MDTIIIFLNLHLSTLNPEEMNFVTFIQILWLNFAATKPDRSFKKKSFFVVNSGFLDDQFGGIKRSLKYWTMQESFDRLLMNQNSPVEWTRKWVHIKNNHRLKRHVTVPTVFTRHGIVANSVTFMLVLFSAILLCFVVNTCLVANRT